MITAKAENAELPPLNTSKSVDSRHDLQRLYLDDVHRYVSSMIGNSGEAEDVCMEVLHAAFRSFDKLKHQENPRVWLLGIARRKVADSLRGFYRRKEVSLDYAVGVPSGGPSIASIHVQLILRKLKPIEAEVLVLKYAMDLSQEEVAAVLGKTCAAINSLLQRARTRFIELETGQSATDMEMP